MSNSKKIGQNKFVTAMIYVVLIFFLIFTMLPFYVIIIASVTPRTEYQQVLNFVAMPMSLSFESFVDLFSGKTNVVEKFLFWENVNKLITGYWNMFWQTVPKSIISMFVSGMAGYAYCKLRFVGQKAMFGIQMSTMMIPTATLTIPTLLYYETLGWTGSVLPLIVPGLFGGTTTIFFMKQFFEGIPTEIVEAARIDGLSEVGIFFKIMLPLSVPAFVSQFILIFIGRYNSYLGPMLYLGTEDKLYPLQLVLQNLKSPWGSDGPFSAAAVCFTIVPIVVIYLFGQKFFVGGLTSGAVKG
jgi:multiple sugar transport system permease protein